MKSNIKIPWRYRIKEALIDAICWTMASVITIIMFLMLGSVLYGIFSIFE